MKEIDMKVPGALAETKGKGKDELVIVALASLVIGFITLIMFL
jgi:hypothetical protein